MEIKPSYKELLHTMEFEPYKPRYIDWNDYDDDSSSVELEDDVDVDVNNKNFNEDLKIRIDMETGEDDKLELLEFEIDEEAFRCSNGVAKNENDLEIDVKIDLEDFNIDYQVCNNILAIFGTKKPSTKNILSQNLEDIIDPSAPTDALIVPKTSIVGNGVREYKSFCRPILLPENADTEKIYTEMIDGLMHIKIPKHYNYITDRDIMLDAETCGMCQWKECFNKHFPGLSEL